jgi:hypothetical protein
MPVAVRSRRTPNAHIDAFLTRQPANSNDNSNPLQRSARSCDSKIDTPPLTHTTTMMMMKTALFAVLALSADAATRIAVLELGKGGTVRRTTSKNTVSNIPGVASFWSAVHTRGRSLQQAGMTVVPDLFNKADAGIVVGIQGSGVDLDNMPFISNLLSEEGGRVVGHMEIEGTHCGALMKTVGNVELVEPNMIAAAVKSHADTPALSGFKTLVESANVAVVEEQLQAFIENLERKAKADGTTIVLHVVVEEDPASASSNRRISRRLEDEADEGGDNQNQNQYNGGDSSGYYGYGYYNAYGEWVTPYKTMFQIQYFNVVLWTALGLILTLYFSVYLMIYMPLEPDTLLFGESAKMVGDE